MKLYESNRIRFNFQANYMPLIQLLKHVYMVKNDVSYSLNYDDENIF